MRLNQRRENLKWNEMKVSVTNDQKGLHPQSYPQEQLYEEISKKAEGDWKDSGVSPGFVQIDSWISLKEPLAA